MTLKEKFENNITGVIGEIQIADEFAVGFADWIRVCKLKGRPYDFENIEQLLLIYKEEKDL